MLVLLYGSTSWTLMKYMKKNEIRKMIYIEINWKICKSPVCPFEQNQGRSTLQNNNYMAT